VLKFIALWHTLPSQFRDFEGIFHGSEFTSNRFAGVASRSRWNQCQFLLDIYRTMVNFVEVGKDGKTPAMRLGLAKGVVSTDDILYFTPEQLG
jgi:hypothetical protein